ncbi:MAG: ABC transporter ATP-binding protein [Candidatus Amulumruptor caecigallinarius]|nr:ABC transporter ATP-binding protein [Candidatus Amulumruptor caecigallinarius]
MLQIENISFSYSKNREIIHNFSMNMEPGCVCGLLGKNGAGKTTLLYLICGLLRPASGRIDFKGYTPFQRYTGFLEDIFIVPEEFSLPKVSLETYIDVNAPFYPNFNKRQMNRYLEIFEMPENINLGKLSMGQKKKAFISFAMACNTGLLILDEPTNGLDITAKRNFRQAIASSMTDDKSIIISTHQVYDVDKILDHVIITDSKGMLLNSPIEEITQNLAFNFTTDRERAAKALISLDVPGGFNIAESLTPGMCETEVNLETLFELIINGKYRGKN